MSIYQSIYDFSLVSFIRYLKNMNDSLNYCLFFDSSLKWMQYKKGQIYINKYHIFHYHNYKTATSTARNRSRHSSPFCITTHCLPANSNHVCQQYEQASTHINSAKNHRISFIFPIMVSRGIVGSNYSLIVFLNLHLESILLIEYCS